MTREDVTADDRMTMMLGSFAILCSMPEPQCTAEIPYYRGMSPGLKYLTHQVLTEEGMIITGSTMFNPRLTRWQKTKRFLWTLLPSKFKQQKPV